MKVNLGNFGSMALALLQARLVSQMREFHQARQRSVFKRTGTPKRLLMGNKPPPETIHAAVRAANAGRLPPAGPIIEGWNKRAAKREALRNA